MAYLSCIHRPSTIRLATKLSFLTPDEDALVIGRSNRLEIYTIHYEGLLLHHSQSLNGNIVALEKAHPASSSTDHLVVVLDTGHDSFAYFTLSWNASTKRLVTEKSFQDLTEFGQRGSQTGERCHVDPTNRFLTIEVFEGIVHVVPIAKESKRAKLHAEIGSLGKPIAARVPELYVKSSAFLHRRSDKQNAQLALLYQNSHEQLCIVIHEIQYMPGLKDDPGTVEWTNSTNIKGQIELGASHLIPLHAPLYGFLILGDTSITYCDEFDQNLDIRPLQEATIWVAWEHLGELDYVLADDYGKLYSLRLQLNHNDEYKSFKLTLLGETSRATRLINLGQDRLFVGSHQGDAQLISLDSGSVQVIQSLPNIAPILDFTVMDMGNRNNEAQVNEFSSGQARLVTGSGAYQNGSLRSIRSGVGIEDLGSIGSMHGITNLFAIKSDPRSRHDDLLFATFITHTRAFRIAASGEIEEVQTLKDVPLSESALLVDTLPDGHIVYVTTKSVTSHDLRGGGESARWTPKNNASISDAALTSSSGTSTLLVSGSELGLVSLSVSATGLEVQASRVFDATSQVSCITLSQSMPKQCIVGFWQGSRIAMLDLQTLQDVHSFVIADNELTVPRSLAVVRLIENAPPSLFIGLANGEVVSYSINVTSSALSNHKSMLLGTQQPQFKILQGSDGLDKIFAICEHPSLIYGSEGRVMYSAITAEEALCVCPLDAAAFPDAVAIATADELKLAVVDEERTTHVQSLLAHETVRRVAYSTEHRAFLLGSIKRTLSGSTEQVRSYIKLVDEVAFKPIDTFELDEEELVSCCIRADLQWGEDENPHVFVVGTAYLDDHKPLEHRGRLIVFEVTEDRKLRMLHSMHLLGACQCLLQYKGRIIAALTKTVIVYALSSTGRSQVRMDKTASYRTSTMPIDMACSNFADTSVIAVSDIMKSVSLLKIETANTSTGGHKDELTEIARHYETMWSTAVAEIDRNTYLQADAEGNLVVLYHDTNGFSDEDRKRLKVTSELWLGEMVNRIRYISVEPTSDAIVIPRAFCATVEGSIYMVSLIKAEKQDLLMRLQENMAGLYASPGDAPFSAYRALKTPVRREEEPLRFVDGELIEQFLSCDADLQEKMVQGLEMSVENVRAMIEELKRLH